jgi:hypothetical protein
MARSGTVNLGPLAGPSVYYVVSATKLRLLDSVMTNDSGATVWVLEQ